MAHFLLGMIAYPMEDYVNRQPDVLSLLEMRKRVYAVSLPFQIGLSKVMSSYIKVNFADCLWDDGSTNEETVPPFMEKP